MEKHDGDPQASAIVLTGATGFLGGHLMAALLERGHGLVLLGRSSVEGNLPTRIKRLLTWFGLADRSPQIETVEADLLKPRFGLEKTAYGALCAKVGSVIHCASDTRFSESRRREISDANVLALSAVIDLAGDGRASCLHYVSTAFVAGGESSLCREVPVNSGAFANVYEETKAQAENDLAVRCRADGVPYTIIRPSIVYGDSRTGRSTLFNALYYHVKALHFIREIYFNDIKKNAGRKSREFDIRLGKDGVLHLPLRIFLPRRGMVNLIPIDYFVSAVLAILDRGKSGEIYHLTSDAPKTLAELLSYCESYLKIDGLQIIYGNPPEAAPLNPPEALLDKFIESYRPYLSDIRKFERGHTIQATGGALPPELTYEIFSRCMDYALRVNWCKP
ncbi:MAG: SDR family oxidoreductase [Candidatus Aminicenantales bacterium]|jgi:nucleoside-diphosphate-sugar epimerase